MFLLLNYKYKKEKSHILTWLRFIYLFGKCILKEPKLNMFLKGYPLEAKTAQKN